MYNVMFYYMHTLWKDQTKLTNKHSFLIAFCNENI